MIRILDNQSFCLTKFLYNKYGNDNVIGIRAPNEIKNEEEVILNYFGIFWGITTYVFRWDWEKNKTPEQPFPNEIYNENTPEFEELKKCIEMFDRDRLFIFCLLMT